MLNILDRTPPPPPLVPGRHVGDDMIDKRHSRQKWAMTDSNRMAWLQSQMAERGVEILAAFAKQAQNARALAEKGES